MAADHLLSNAMRELDEFRRSAAQKPRTVAAAVATPKEASETSVHRVHQDTLDAQELLVSEVYTLMDHAYEPPTFSYRRVGPLADTERWTNLMAFAYFKGIVLDSDALDAHARWLRDILLYLREYQMVNSDYTSDLATSRLLTALGCVRGFRRQFRSLRAADASDFSDVLEGVVSYICYNHHDPPHERAWRRWLARRVAAAEDATPLDAAPPTTIEQSPETSQSSPEPLDPPPYKARHYTSSIEAADESKWNGLLLNAFGEFCKHRAEPPPQQHLHILRFTLSRIKEKQLAQTPYFDNMSDDRLQRLLEEDAGFAAEMQRLTSATGENAILFEPAYTRIVNYLCQPRKRAKGVTRNVRFAPY